MPPKRKRASKEKKYKLSYFAGRGLAECSRLLFAHAGVEFEDFRFSMERGPKGEYIRPEWDVAKATMPFHKVPVLGVDDVKIPQSKAIERYLAKQFKLLGKNDTEAALIEAIVEQINDNRSEWRTRKGKPDSERKEAVESYFTDYLPKELPLLEKFVTDNEEGFFVGKKLSYADIALFEWLGTFTDNTDDIAKVLAKFPGLKKLNETVGEDDGIKAWVEKRPKTSF